MRVLIAALLIGAFTSPALAVFGGLAADTSEFSFVRYVQFEYFDRTTGYCSGTLLERGMILTAAHCVVNKSNVRAKKITVRLKRGDPNGVEVWGASVHPDYEPGGGSFNDIAILHTFSENDGHATLPYDYAWKIYKSKNAKAWYPYFLNNLSSEDLRDIFDKSIPRDPKGNLWAYIVGFGLTCPESECPILTNTARYVGKPIFGSSAVGACDRKPFDFKTGPKRFCAFTADASITRPTASDGRSNANKGDSGGPMFSFDSSGKAIVIGITSTSTDEALYFISVYDHIEFFRNSLNGANNKVRSINFERGGSDSAERKIENTTGMRDVVPLIKEMLEKSEHDNSGKRLGSAIQHYYANEVLVHGKKTSRDQLRTDLDAYSVRWPLRTYRMSKIMKSSLCFDQECTVHVIVVANRYRNMNDNGEGGGKVYTWVWRREGGTWRIVSEASRPSTAKDDEG